MTLKDVKRGSIILYKENNKKLDLLGKIIKFFTNGIYTHSAIYWGKGRILEISPLYLKVINITKKTNQNYDVGILPDSIQPIINLGLKYVQIISKNFKWYDSFNALFFIILKVFRLNKFRPFFKLFETKKNVVCSEVVCNYLSFLGLKKLSFTTIPDSLISPSEIPKAFKIKVKKIKKEY